MREAKRIMQQINGCEVTMIFPAQADKEVLKQVKEILSYAYTERMEQELDQLLAETMEPQDQKNAS